MAGYRLRPGARADLREIARYTEKAWGRPQRRNYIAALEACFRMLAESPGLGGPLEGTAYRRHRQRAHIVVYRGVGEDIEIVRVLHASMDLPARLASTD